MAYEYTDERREPEGALPDVEVFHSSEDQTGVLENLEPGFYYAFGSPGCLWDSDPYGPFTTYQAALDDARRHGDCCEDNAPEQEEAE